MDREEKLAMFRNVHSGKQAFQALKHKKNNAPFSDVDYFELLGRKAIEMDKNNPDKTIPTDYGIYDRDCVKLAKEVCRGLDNGKSKNEMLKYLNRCIDFTC